MSEMKNQLNNVDKHVNKTQGKLSFNNIKKIRRDLINLAKDEILDIKKSKKDVTIETFINQEIIAPSKYSLTAKDINLNCNKKYSSKFETVEENVKNDKYKKDEEKRNDVNKNEISSSDISDDEE